MCMEAVHTAQESNVVMCNVKLTLDSGIVELRVPEQDVIDAEAISSDEGGGCIKLLEPRLAPRRIRDFKIQYVSGVSRAVKVVAMNAEESVFVAGGSVGMITQNNMDVVDARTLRKIATLPVHCYPVTCAEFSTSCQTLLTCDNTNSINIWDMNTFHVKRTIEAPEADGLKEYRFLTLKVSPNNTMLLAAGEEINAAHSTGVVMGWSMTAVDTPMLTFHEHSDRVYGLAIRWCGQMVASSDKGGTVHVWRAPDTEVLQTLKMPGSAQIVRFSQDGGRVIAISERVVGVWDTATWQLVMSRHLEDGPRLICPTEFEEQPGAFIAHRYLVMTCVPGDYIFCSTSQNLVLIYEQETLEEVARYSMKTKVISVTSTFNKVTFGDLWGNVAFLEVT
eukprot:TRINITY_DN12942_c0_g1_i1.p1 TRINITY_DN12942_c0_g1~~TRINITY_DN12942_c0_g1_i1.p1  ORF type:complete len:391 (+),score=122.48 TRINITY_DN12942_c0_g1_i1:1445-2617(+)